MLVSIKGYLHQQKEWYHHASKCFHWHCPPLPGLGMQQGTNLWPEGTKLINVIDLW